MLCRPSNELEQVCHLLNFLRLTVGLCSAPFCRCFFFFVFEQGRFAFSSFLLLQGSRARFELISSFRARQLELELELELITYVSSSICISSSSSSSSSSPKTCNRARARAHQKRSSSTR
ncbi:UNVERIFIED_CONTAM: hypothetical protein Sangu_0692700 [Sesamum angustifolium]|uniref:Secreted protein n=1 Tax=Sesamum angustifolium TaxID=2727405 RepID=A0AAW2PTP0_9LAMI